jgi:hypothetical protein
MQALYGMGPPVEWEPVEDDIVCTVRAFRPKPTLEDAIELHAFAPLEALACVWQMAFFWGGVFTPLTGCHCKLRPNTKGFKYKYLPHWPAKVTEVGPDAKGKHRFLMVFFGDETAAEAYNAKKMQPFKCSKYAEFKLAGEEAAAKQRDATAFSTALTDALVRSL